MTTATLHTNSRSSSSPIKREQHVEIRKFIEQIMTEKRWNATDLARNAGIAPSTILRFLKDETSSHTLSFSTLKYISEGSGYAIPQKVMESSGITRVEAVSSEPRQLASGDLTPTLIRVQHVSALPEGIQPMIKEAIRISRPAELNGDNSAFAFSMPDDSLAPLIPARSMMFATKSVGIMAGEIAIIIDREGRAKVGLVDEVRASGVSIVDKDAKGGVVSFRHDQIKDYGIVRVINRAH
jgi:DNA-binding Xre family transcriptional regulator